MFPATMMPAGESQVQSEKDVGKKPLKSRLYHVPVPSILRREARRYPRSHIAHLSLRLEVVEEDGALLRLLTPVLNNDARAVDDLAGVALAVEDA